MKIFKQIAIIIGFSLLGEILSWSLSKLIPNFFFPGSLIGMMILFLFLNFNIIKIDTIASVGSFFVDNMGFFFIPAAVSIMSYFDIIAPNIWKMLLLCMISFLTTFCAISLSAHFTLLIQEKIQKDRANSHE